MTSRDREQWKRWVGRKVELERDSGTLYRGTLTSVTDQSVAADCIIVSTGGNAKVRRWPIHEVKSIRTIDGGAE